jgi:hypothetical protein
MTGSGMNFFASPLPFPSFAAWGCPSRCRQVYELGKNAEKVGSVSDQLSA